MPNLQATEVYLEDVLPFQLKERKEDVWACLKKKYSGAPGIAYIVYLPIHSTLCHQYIQGPPKLKLTRGVEKNKEKSGYAS